MSQTLATYDWQEADPRFAPLPGKPRANHVMVKIAAAHYSEEKEFIVHRELLTRCQSRLFRSILGPIENSKYFKLVIDPRVLTGLLQFAYRGRFWLPETIKNIEILWDLYIFAEKKEIPILQDVMMNRIVSFYFKSNTFPTTEIVMYVYKHTKPESSTQTHSTAQRFLARCYVSQSLGCFYGSKCRESDTSIDEALLRADGLQSDTMKAIWEPAGSPWKVETDPRNPVRVKPCDYHQHMWNEMCPKYRETCFDSETDV
ncbi:uncharacterized protein EAF01_011118 [Botrytis porri]|uniref:BTB domain-containing protein n=1 Tax=Botrytis porri TaxID=87229 RepID=A0A4Z1KY41_9HELO|nr:uncharacterized protein EAF01_011118 [Botrytis porri]KAF7887964.1 hypothetical protein EAF01_011118 [Botrytis porri]TGO89386.1 hypothetical protein BPOR_0112g00170 [Botrytis porri]